MWNVGVQQIIAGDQKTIAIPVAGTGVAYSQSVKIDKGVYFGIAYKGAGTGTIGVNLQLEESDVVPVKEGSSDANFAIPDSLADIHTNLADTNLHRKALSPITAKYCRLKLTGVSSNPSNCTVTASMSIQEEL